MQKFDFEQPSNTFHYFVLLAIRPGSLFWSNTLSVLQNPDVHIKPWKCDFEKHSITFGYFVLPAIIMGSILLSNSPSDVQNYVFSQQAVEVWFWTTLRHFAHADIKLST